MRIMADENCAILDKAESDVLTDKDLADEDE